MVRIGKCPKCRSEMIASAIKLIGEYHKVICVECGHEQDAKDHQIIGNVMKGYKKRIGGFGE